MTITGCGGEEPQPAPAKVAGQDGDIGQPPAPPADGAPADGPGATFAVSKLLLGMTDSNGMTDVYLWKQYGYNLDRTVTAEGALMSCSAIKGTPPKYLSDGDEGRDNGFGRGVLPIASSLKSDVQPDTTAAIQNGLRTILITVPGLGDAPAYGTMSARLYEGAALTAADGTPMKPLFDGTDVWPVTAESVQEGKVDKPLAQASAGYLAEEGEGGTFVAQFEGSIVFRIPFLGNETDEGVAVLRIHEPLVTMTFSADRKSVTRGMIAGVLHSEELVIEYDRIAGAIFPDQCGGANFMVLRDQVEGTADIRRDREVAPDKPCDATSIGIAFEAVRAELGTVAMPAPPLPLGCIKP